MKYIEIRIEAKVDELEAVSIYLSEKGISSFSVEDPTVVDEILDKQHPHDWDYVDEELWRKKKWPSAITLYLEEEENALAEEIVGEGKNRNWKISCRTADDGEWKDSYKEHFRSLQLTEGILVVPSWEDHDGIAGRDYMDMDPGMAFGTGDHATTSMCAELMEQVGCQGKKVLDVGTGSGILAIGASMLGSRDVLGVDIDPVAVEIAIENVKKNAREEEITIVAGDLTKGLDYVADIVVANLVAEVIMILAEHVKKHLSKGGYFISSGILVEKEEMVLDKLKEERLEICEIHQMGEWSAILAKYE